MLVIKDIKHKAGDFVLGPLSMTIHGGEYWIVAGPSGAGKSMFLELLAGLRQVSEGNIFYRDEDITRLPAHQRRFGMVFQDVALFPHLSVEQNIAYPLRLLRKSPNEIDAEVKRLAELTGILHLVHRRPVDISGGEARRVAIARTLAMQPRLLLSTNPLQASMPAFVSRFIMFYETSVSPTYPSYMLLTTLTKLCRWPPIWQSSKTAISSKQA